MELRCMPCLADGPGMAAPSASPPQPSFRLGRGYCTALLVASAKQPFIIHGTDNQIRPFCQPKLASPRTHMATRDSVSDAKPQSAAAFPKPTGGACAYGGLQPGRGIGGLGDAFTLLPLLVNPNVQLPNPCDICPRREVNRVGADVSLEIRDSDQWIHSYASLQPFAPQRHYAVTTPFQYGTHSKCIKF